MHAYASLRICCPSPTYRGKSSETSLAWTREDNGRGLCWKRVTKTKHLEDLGVSYWQDQAQNRGAKSVVRAQDNLSHCATMLWLLTYISRSERYLHHYYTFNTRIEEIFSITDLVYIVTLSAVWVNVTQPCRVRFDPYS